MASEAIAEQDREQVEPDQNEEADEQQERAVEDAARLRA